MTLGKRERILAVAVGAIALAIVGRYLFAALAGPFRELADRRDKLAEELDEKATRFGKLQKAQARMIEWNRHSLPADVEDARLLYNNWLLQQVDRVKFRREKVESGEARAHRGMYTVLPFTVRGQGSLEQLTQFLYGFYSAGHLHKIHRWSIEPIEKSQDFKLTIWIEALSLPTAVRRDKDKLSEEPSSRLTGADLAAYQKEIAGRKLFAPYAPPAAAPVVAERKPDPPPPAFDHSKYVYVTGITKKDGKPQVWLKARTTDEKFILFEGESFQVGSVKASVQHIGTREVKIEVNGEPRTLQVGQSLKEGSPAPKL